MGYGLGVDLGTTFTRAAIGAHGQSRIVTVGEGAITAAPMARPSTAPPSGGDQLVCGGDLLVRAGLGTVRSNPESCPESWLPEPVPLVLGGGPHRGAPVLAEALRSALQSVTAAQGEAPEAVVLTCPAVWGPVRRRQFGEVSRQVGLELVTVISEPEAATTFFAQAGRLSEADVVAVYDLGAVTVDLTVVRVTGTGTEILGQPEALEGIGGSDFDEVVLQHVDRALAGALSRLDLNDPPAVAVLADLRAECVRAKEALSWAETTTLTVNLPTEVVRVVLTRSEFESMIKAGLESTLLGLRRSMLSAGVGIADLAGVVLAGGSSRIPLVARMLENALGCPVLVHEHPRHCVALGAAAIADGFPNRIRARVGPSTAPLSRRETMPTGRRAPVSVSRRAVVSASRRAATSGLESSVPPGRRLRVRPRILALGAVTVLVLASVAYLIVSALVSGPSSMAQTNRSGDRAAGPPTDRLADTRSPALALEGAVSPVSESLVAMLPKVVAIRKAAPTTVISAAATGALIGPAGKCLDVQSAQTADGTPVQLFTCNGTAAQVWTAGRDGSLRAFGKCLQSGDRALVISGCTGAATQRWQVVSGSIRKAGSKQCVAVLGSANDLDPVGMAACGRPVTQQWKLVT